MSTIRFEDFVRNIPDFPSAGIQFKDISPLLASGAAFRVSVQALADRCEALGATSIASIEARGFIFGAALAAHMSKPFVMIRKPGKLPYSTTSVEYALEYGSGKLEVHTDAFSAGDAVLVVDDVLATGGTAAAVEQLVTRAGASVAGYAFAIELEFLQGRQRLGGAPVISLIRY